MTLVESPDPERALALSYAVRGRRAAEAIFALDDALARVLRTTTEPMVGMMRLAWWREALERLDVASPPAEPVLAALAGAALPAGVTGAALAPIVEGWEMLLNPDPIDEEALRRYARRGGALFGAIATVLGAAAADPVERAGEGWALVDLVWHLRDRQAAATAVALARTALDAATRRRWSRPGRPLGALAHLARRDLKHAPERRPRKGSPARLARMLRHRFTGR